MKQTNAEGFTNAMLNIYEEAKKAGINLPKYRQMVEEHGGIETAKRLVNSNNTDGFIKLLMAGKKYLTVEALILKDEWREFFSLDELQKAEQKLR